MDKKFENQITQIIDNMEKIARDYEIAIKKGRFETKCPYLNIIKIYENICQTLIEHRWDKQVMIFNKQIKFYYKKLEKDKKLRKIEAQKVEKQKKFEDLHKIKEIDAIKTLIQVFDKEQEILNFEEKKKEKVEESEKIFNLIDNAETMARKYEQEIKRGIILHLDCPYEKIIEIYKEAKEKFENIGWKEESNKLHDSIRYYQEKFEKDKKLREIEKKKRIKKL